MAGVHHDVDAHIGCYCVSVNVKQKFMGVKRHFVSLERHWFADNAQRFDHAAGCAHGADVCKLVLQKLQATYRKTSCRAARVRRYAVLGASNTLVSSIQVRSRCGGVAPQAGRGLQCIDVPPAGRFDPEMSGLCSYWLQRNISSISTSRSIAAEVVDPTCLACEQLR